MIFKKFTTYHFVKNEHQKKSSFNKLLKGSKNCKKMSHSRRENVTFFFTVFVKKNEYSNPDLEIKNFLKNEKKILQSKESKLKINNEVIIGELSNKYINSINKTPKK